MKTIIIADKRFIKESNKSIVFLTNGYGGRFVIIPKSQIIKVEDAFLKVNDQGFKKAKSYVITNWIFDGIKDDLKRMLALNDCYITPERQ